MQYVYYVHVLTKIFRLYGRSLLATIGAKIYHCSLVSEQANGYLYIFLCTLDTHQCPVEPKVLYDSCMKISYFFLINNVMHSESKDIFLDLQGQTNLFIVQIDKE